MRSRPTRSSALLNKFGVKKPAPGEPWQVAETPAGPAAQPARAGSLAEPAATLTGNGRRADMSASPPHRIDVLTLFPAAF